jgi:hypothetical protein
VDRTIARWRLRTQQLVAPHAGSVGEVLGRLLAVQAENPAQSAWAVAARTVRPDAQELADHLASGAVVRTHVLRPTWHYVAREDLDWLLALTGPRVLKVFDTQLFGELGLSTGDHDRLAGAVLDLLAEQPDRTRDEVAEALRARVPGLADRVTGRLVMLLMGRLEVDRLLASGAPRDGEHTYARYDQRVGDRVDLDDFDREAALARLALRYVTGHGPATEKDLAYWATLPVTEVRRGLAAVAEELESFEHDGRTYWHRPGSPPSGPGEPDGHLLQLLDEMYRGYQDSRYVLDARGVVPREREKAVGMGLVDGQLVAAMRRTVGSSGVRFELALYSPLTRAQRRALDQAAARYGDFLGLPAEVTVT